jgi:hypothetical protein
MIIPQIERNVNSFTPGTKVIWRNAGADIPATITACLGAMGGENYYSILQFDGFASPGGVPESQLVIDATSAQPNSREANAEWFISTFVPCPERGYALMNPPGYEAKYSRRNEGLTPELVIGALNGQTRRTRSLPVGGGKWISVAITLAVTPQTKGERPLAKEITLDIDNGGLPAIKRVLDVLNRNGLWAFVQLSESATHDGGHVRIPCAELLPASMLNDIGHRIAFAASVEAEVWPCDADLRLPLQIHLRAPGGPKRFPLLLPTGEMIDAGDVWQALDSLRIQFQPNATTCITKALETLPDLPEPEKQTQPRHRSDVNNAKVSSVIGWYVSNFSLRNQLEDAGAEFKRDNQHFVCCPFHEDHSPSLAIWRHKDNDKYVCHCYSKNSNCAASKGDYLDAFDVYKLHQKLSASEAVKKLVEDHQLGKKRETVIEVAPVQEVRTVEAHNQEIAQARRRLTSELQKASESYGEVTAFKVTPGLGKTHQAAELANKLYGEGKRVAIFAPTKEIANIEWMSRLRNGHVWESKIDSCICHEKKFLSKCIENGYAMPECFQPDCPYLHQAQTSYGKQIIYQHNHLHIRDGEKLDALVLIIDESPLSALLPEKSIRGIHGFIERHPDDPAAPLLTAIQTATKGMNKTINDVRGQELISAIEAQLNGLTLAKAIKQAKCSPFYLELPPAPGEVEKMSPQFLYALVNVLETGSEKLSYGRCNGGRWGLVWHERKTLALSVYNLLSKPAVIILDGSADETIYKPLCEPWPFQMVTIDCPISPDVEITQITCTPSTRHVVKSVDRIEGLARQVAQVANKLNVIIDGGVTFMAAVDTMEDIIGGQWLHYGGQRGNNELSDARTIAVVCSPTNPPYAIERKALALWIDLAVEWKSTGVTGSYEATDERLNAMNRLHTFEELRQAIYRARPLTPTAPTKLLVFTPWDLSCIGLCPNQTFTNLEHGNSTPAKAALSEYAARRGRVVPLPDGESLHKNSVFQNGIIYSDSVPRIGNEEFCAPISSPPPQPAKEELAPAASIYAPMVGDILTKFGKKIFVKRLNAEKVWFDVFDLGQSEGTHWLPVASFADQVVQMAPKIERVNA